jgi:dipeptidyl aminopeptidase/acylaminoacyl peptidase
MSKHAVNYWFRGLVLAASLVALVSGGTVAWAQQKKTAKPSMTILEEHQVELQRPIQSLAFSPDGKILAVGGHNIALFEVGEGEPQQRAILPTNIFFGVKSLAFSTDGTMLAVAGGDKSVRLWDLSVQPAQQRQVLKDHVAAVTGVSFSPDGKLLASCSDDNNALLWNVDGGQATERGILKTNDVFGVRAVAFNPKFSKVLATTSGNGQVRIWDVSGAAPKQTGSLKTPGGIFEMRLAYSPNGREVAVASRRTVYLLSKGGPVALNGHKGNVKDLAYSPDGRTLASAGDDGRLILWNLTSNRPRLTK